MKKIVFLDIDGVLNTERWYTQMTKDTPKDKFGYAFDPTAIKNLSRVINDTGADIVISSSWKCFGIEGMQEMWRERNLPGRVIDITPNTISDEMLLRINLDELDDYALRGLEIKDWLSKRDRKVSDYAIIDDVDGFLPEQKSHLVLTNPIYGISKEDADKTIAILNGLDNLED